MKKFNLIAIVMLMALTFASCDRVAPNYYGVLMENFGKDGKSDYSRQQGRVSVMSPGTELFQVPAWEQRAEFTETVQKDGDETTIKRMLRLRQQTTQNLQLVLCTLIRLLKTV